MNRTAGMLAGCALFLAVAVASDRAHAQGPAYYVLRSPAAETPHHGGRYYPAAQVPVSAQPYAYGWFGAGPRRHWSRHFGHYNQYTQWTAQ